MDLRQAYLLQTPNFETSELVFPTLILWSLLIPHRRRPLAPSRDFSYAKQMSWEEAQGSARDLHDTQAGTARSVRAEGFKSAWQHILIEFSSFSTTDPSQSLLSTARASCSAAEARAAEAMASRDAGMARQEALNAALRRIKAHKVRTDAAYRCLHGARNSRRSGK